MKSQKGFSVLTIVFILISISALAGVGYLAYKQFSVPREQIQTQQNLQQNHQNETRIGNSPIKILSTEIPNGSFNSVSGSIQYDCQPKLFDPNITEFKKEKTGGTPDELYTVEGFNGMMINGWQKEGDNKITLANPYQLTNYQFGCASTFSSVVEIKKSGARQGLYTHINNYLTQSSVSQDGKHIFIANNIENQNGTWQKIRRIINVETNSKIILPNMNCVSNYAQWSGDTLVTHTDYSQAINPGDKTKVCLWNSDGKLMSQLEGEFYWNGANTNHLLDKIGVLPDDSSIFYAYTALSTTYPEVGDVCYLVFQDTKNQQQYRKIQITKVADDPAWPFCPKMDFNFQNIKFDSRDINYTPGQ